MEIRSVSGVSVVPIKKAKKERMDGKRGDRKEKEEGGEKEKGKELGCKGGEEEGRGRQREAGGN